MVGPTLPRLLRQVLIGLSHAGACLLDYDGASLRPDLIGGVTVSLVVGGALVWVYSSSVRLTSRVGPMTTQKGRRMGQRHLVLSTTDYRSCAPRGVKTPAGPVDYQPWPCSGGGTGYTCSVISPQLRVAHDTGRC